MVIEEKSVAEVREYALKNGLMKTLRTDGIRKVIAGIQPLMAQHFNLTVELPLKAMVRGYSYAVVPNSWTNRSEGESKFHIREMGSRYFLIIFYAWLEKTLTHEDYSKRTDLWRSQLQVWRK